MPTPALQTFDAFRVELDDYNDRRERLIKVSVPDYSLHVWPMLHFKQIA